MMTTADYLTYETELYERTQSEFEHWLEERETAPAEKHGADASMSTVNRWGYYGMWMP